MSNRFFWSFLFSAYSIGLGFSQNSQTSETKVQTETLFIDAARNKMIGRNDLAIGQYQEIIKKDPDNHVVYYELAKAFLVSKKTEEALDAINSALASQPSEKYYLLTKAGILNQRQDFLAEADIYKRLSALEPLKEIYYDRWSALLAQSAKWDEIILALNIMEQKKGVNEISARRKSQAFDFLNKPKQAEDELLKLIHAFPRDISYLHDLASYYKKHQKDAKALEIYKKILTLDNSDEKANLSMAASLKNSGNDRLYLTSIYTLLENPAISLDAKIIELIPYTQKAIQTKNKDLLLDLDKIAKSLVDQYPDQAKTHAFYGDILHNLSKESEAINHYKTALSLNNRVGTVWSQYLSLIADQPEYSAEAEKAFDLFPNDPQIAFQYAHSLYKKQEYKEVIIITQQALLMAMDQKSMQEKLFSLLGSAYYKSDQSLLSEQAFEKALDINAQSLPTLHMQAYLYAQKGEKLDKATKLIQNALKLQPDNFQLEYVQALILYKEKNWIESKKWFDHALSHGGQNSAQILEALGDLYFQTKEIEQALNYWQKAAYIIPDNARLRKKIADKSVNE